MKRLHRKFSSRRGETLTETLCAMVVISLSSVLLATMISAAVHLNTTAMDEDAKRLKELNVAQEHTAGAQTTITVTPVTDSTTETFSVSLYREAEGALTAYAYLPATTPEPEPEPGGGGTP